MRNAQRSGRQAALMDLLNLLQHWRVIITVDCIGEENW